MLCNFKVTQVERKNLSKPLLKQSNFPQSCNNCSAITSICMVDAFAERAIGAKTVARNILILIKPNITENEKEIFSVAYRIAINLADQFSEFANETLVDDNSSFSKCSKITDIRKLDSLSERAFGAKQAAKNILRIMNFGYSDDLHETILQAHLSALETTVQFELKAKEFEPEKEILL